MLSEVDPGSQVGDDEPSVPPHGDFSYAAGESSVLRRALIRTVEQMGGQRRLRRLYESRHEKRLADENFFETAVRLLGVHVRFDPAALAKVPSHGPILFVANHPFGILDGIVLVWLAMKVRPDIKVLVHSALTRVPETRPHFLPIDFSETVAARDNNVAMRAAAINWLGTGHAIGVFPGGAISTVERWSGYKARDLSWAPFTARMIFAARPTVVPIYFSGQNSRLFQIASHLSLTLRLSLIMRETARRIGTPVDVAIGEPVPGHDLVRIRDRDALLGELRRRTYALAGPAYDDDCMRVGRIRMRNSDPTPRSPSGRPVRSGREPQGAASKQTNPARPQAAASLQP